MKICLDAGHYAKYNPSPAVAGYYESEMNWKLHNLLKKYLEEKGFEVIVTRKDQTKDMGLTARGQAAKGCDLFMSIHSNAVGSNGANEEIDYPVVYVPINGTGDEIGKKLADCIASVMGTKQPGRAVSRKGSGDWDYYSVIFGAVSVGVTGLILEHSFHTNTRSTKWLMDDSNLDKLAKAEAEVLAKHYGVKPEVIYRVQVGAFSNKKYADDYYHKVKAAGIDCFMVLVDGIYKIQVGAFSVKNNADNMLAKVKKAGFDAFITTKGGTAVSVTTEKKSVTEIAKEVVQGKWGNGLDRKNRLTAAGYDYTAVQNEVNRIMKG